MKRTVLIYLILSLILATVNTLNIYSEKETGEKKKDIKELFENKYNEWKGFMDSPASKMLSDSTGSYTPQYQEIINLGIPAIPYIIGKMENDHRLFIAVRLITKKWDWDKNMPAKDRVLWYLNWWKENRKQTPQQFEKLCRDAKTLKKEGREKESQEKKQDIIKMGLDVLPLIVDKIEDGESDLIPAFVELTSVNTMQGSMVTGYKRMVPEDATPSECLEWWAKNKKQWLLQPVESELKDLTDRLETLTKQEFRRLKGITGEDFGEPKDKDNSNKWRQWWEEYRKTYEITKSDSRQESKPQIPPDNKPEDKAGQKDK